MEKDKLVEIKKGQTGTGLLIENDGYICASKELVNEGNVNGEWHCPNPFIVDAVFQKYGIKNANGRIYPEALLKREVEKYQTKIMEHRALGELNHPAESVIDLSRVSHNIIELHWEGHTLVGKMELNLTPGFIKHGIASSQGDMTANLLLNGYKVGVSSRGVGSVETRLGQQIVSEDFELICWDVVSDPSTNNAWISINGEEDLKPWVEDVDRKDKDLISEKIEKITNILKN